MREGLRPPAGRPAAVLRRNQVYTSLRLCPRYILTKFHYNPTKGLAVIVRQTDRQTDKQTKCQTVKLKQDLTSFGQLYVCRPPPDPRYVFKPISVYPI